MSWPAVQSCGAVLVLDSGWLIAQASANLSSHLGVEAQWAIGRPAGELLSEAAIHGLRNRLALKRAAEGVTRLARCLLTGDQRAFDVALHHCEQAVIIELQPSSDLAVGGDLVTTVRALIASLADQTPDAGFADGARMLRALTGFDRVRVHRRSGELGWEQLGEAVRSGLRTAGDGCAVPPVVLERLSLVADRDSPPVALLGQPPFSPSDDGAGLDRIILAPPGPALLDYLHGCGTSALMTFPLVIGGDIWGMIDCHHSGPRMAPMAVQAAAELFAEMWALRIEIGELRERLGKAG